MKEISLLLTASLLTSFGIIFPQVWLLVFPGLGLFFQILRTRSAGVTRVAILGLIFGVITGGAGTIWFWDTLPLTFLGIHDPVVQRTAVAMTWCYVAISLGLPVPFGALAIWFLREWRCFPLAASLIWVLVEIARMWSFAVTTWGPQSLFGPHFSAASVGYALTESPVFLKLAYPFGVNALNFVVALGPAILVGAMRDAGNSLGRGALASLLAALIFLYQAPWVAVSTSLPRDGDSLRFAIVSETIEDVQDFSTHARVSRLLAEAAATTPAVDVVVLPEEFSLTSMFWSRREANAFIKAHFGDREVLILNTRNNLYPEDERNELPESKKLVYDSTTRGEIGRYVKQMLMPLGEYAPSFTNTFFSIINDPELRLYLDDIGSEAPVAPGGSVAAFRGAVIGGLLCSDMLSPRLYHELARKQGASVLVNLSNHFWFHGSKTLYWKTMQMARVHAARERLPLLVSNNLAPAFALDASGAIIARSPWGKSEILYVDLPVGHDSRDAM